MDYLRSLLLVMCIGVFGSGCGSNDPHMTAVDMSSPNTFDMGIFDTPEEAAQSILHEIQTSKLSQGTLTLMNINSAEEAKRVKLELPLTMYALEMSCLAAYKTGDDPKSCLKSWNRIFYYVSTDTEVKGYFVLTKYDNGKWDWFMFGSNGIPADYAVSRKFLHDTYGIAPDAITITDVYWDGYEFLTYDTPQGLQMITAWDLTSPSWKANTPKTADEVYKLIQPDAQRH